MGYEVLDDRFKRRLTDPDIIAEAVAVLRADGVDETDLLVELLKMFYVDLDEFAEVLRAA